MKKQYYVYVTTGEVVEMTIRQAKRYFKQDAKKYNYHYQREWVVALDVYMLIKSR